MPPLTLPLRTPLTILSFPSSSRRIFIEDIHCLDVSTLPEIIWSVTLQGCPGLNNLSTAFPLRKIVKYLSCLYHLSERAPARAMSFSASGWLVVADLPGSSVTSPRLVLPGVVVEPQLESTHSLPSSVRWTWDQVGPQGWPVAPGRLGRGPPHSPPGRAPPWDGAGGRGAYMQSRVRLS